jgi:hypothetical protein
VFPEEGGYELIPSERQSGRWGQRPEKRRLDSGVGMPLFTEPGL